MSFKKLFIFLVIASILTAIIFFIYEYKSNEKIIIDEIPISEKTDLKEDTELVKENKEIEYYFEVLDESESFTNTIGNCSVNYSKTYPLINSSDTELANKLNQKIEKYYKAQIFNNDNFADIDCQGESTEEIQYNKILENDKILSLEKSSYSYYAGAAHPNSYSNYYHFNVQNAEEILFTNLLNENALKSENLEALYLLILEKLNTAYPSLSNEWWIENPEEIINDETQFYILENKLYIYFNTYDIAAYALGPIEISFELEELNNFFKPEIINLWK